MADNFQPSNPDPGKMDSRLHQSGVTHNVPVGKKRKGAKIGDKKDKKNMPWLEDAEDPESKRISLKAIVLLTLGSAVAVVTIALILKSQPNAVDTAPPPPKVTTTNDGILNGPPVFNQPPEKIANAFITSTDPQERLKWVRNPDQVAGRMGSYPKQALNETVEKLTPMGSASVQDMVFARYMARFPNGGRRLLCVVATDAEPKIDWDAYSRYCSASWADITQGKVKQAEVRAFLKPGYTYTGDYRDDTVWQCYQLTSPDTDETIYVYARRDSTRGKLLASTLPEGSKAQQRMTLTLSSVENGHSHGQYEIDRVHAIGWVRADKDIEDVWIPSPLNAPKKKAGDLSELESPGH